MSTVVPRIAIYLRTLGGGGVEHMLTNLACSFVKRGLKVDMVLNDAGKSSEKLPPEIRVVNLDTPRMLAGFSGLVRYLQKEQPTALLSSMHYNTEIAIMAKRLSGVSTRVVVREPTNLSQDVRYASRLKQRFLPPLLARVLYPFADGIVAVSHGVAEDLAQITGLPLERIQVIYNPVVTPELLQGKEEPVEHPWFAPGEPPVILGAGRLKQQKDFSMLIRSFAQVRQTQPARLMILGSGPERSLLKSLVQELDLQDDVALPGFVTNPFAYMARASVFVLSSAWEGLPNVLTQALAVGTPVVSTDCPSGPAEILDRGKYGWLVPVGDSRAMAEAISAVLAGNSKEVDPIWLDQFTVEAATEKYLQALSIT